MPGQHDHRGAEPQPSGAGAEPGQQVERRRDLAIAGEMMLDDKGAVKPERLGLDVVFDEIAKPFAAVELGSAAPRRGAAEQAKLHRCSLLGVHFGQATASRAMFLMPSFNHRHIAPA